MQLRKLVKISVTKKGLQQYLAAHLCRFSTLEKMYIINLKLIFNNFVAMLVN